MIKFTIRAILIAAAAMTLISIYTGHFQEWSGALGHWITPPLIAVSNLMGEWLANLFLRKP